MIHLKNILPVLLLFVWTTTLFGQPYADKKYYLVDSLDLPALIASDRHLIDSCLKVYHAAAHDTDRVNALNGICEEMMDETWYKYQFIQYRLIQKALADYPANPPIVVSALRIALADALNNIGYIHSNQGDIPLALEYYHKSLKIREEFSDKKGMAYSYNNIGAIHDNQGDISLALEYYHKSLKIQEEISEKQGMAYSYNNIGVIHEIRGDNSLAHEYFFKGLKIQEEISDKKGMASSYNNIGAILCKMDSTEKGLSYLNLALRLAEEMGNKQEISDVSAAIGNQLLKEGKLQQAREHGQRGLKIAQEIGYPDQIERNAGLLSRVAIKQNNFLEAFEMRNLQIQMRDSIANVEAVEAAARQQSKYEHEKTQAIKDKEHEKQIALSAEREEKQKIVSYTAAGASMMLVAFLVFVFNRLKITRRQKTIIETTHRQLATHHKEIQDSIRYAKRIQEAILPSLAAVHKALKDSFVLYKPKDVVAGDFYWLESKGDTVYFAAADCTGHGVPGAMVSVVCSYALSKALLEENITNTGELLDRTRELVIERFAKSGEEVKDGMDISLCGLNLKTLKLQWSGANNPLRVFSKGKLVKYRPDKMPIGNYADPKPFTTHDIQLEKEDIIYIFTDGYPDQFGGAKGSKFMARRLSELILSLAAKTMEEQKQILHKSFEDWKGELEQVDDVCMIGVRV